MQPFLLLLAAFACVALQSSLANLWTWSGARVELMPALVAYAAVSTRWPLALWLAVAGGVFQDALSANRLGVSAVALSSVALAFYPPRRFVMREQLAVQFVVGGAASLLFSLLQWLLLTLGGLGWAFSWAGLARVAQVATLSLLVTPLLFRGLDRARAWVGELRTEEES